MKLNLGCGPYPLDGFVNLDKNTWWEAEHGLPYADDSITAITISHLLYIMEADDYPALFREIERALERGSVVRITDDDTENPAGRRYNKPYPWSVSFPGPRMVRQHLSDVGLQPYDVPPDKSLYHDTSLIQCLHGLPPHVFFIEGIKP